MIKFGIIGCGMIASVNAEAISNISSAKLIGATDNRFEVASAFAQERGIKAYESYEAMLSDENINAVVICTPSFLHAENAIMALEKGKHVVLEKPMALSVADADKIIETVERTGKVLTVISQNRFLGDLQYVKELIKENAFGKISLCTLSMKYYRTKEYYSSSPWKGTLKFDGGGALMNQGIHGIDLLQYLAGDIKKVQGTVRTLSHDIEVEDTAVATVEFESGALGTILASTCAYPGFERKIEIIGDNGYAHIKENKIVSLIINGVKQDVEIKHRINTSADPKSLTYDAHKEQIENFIGAIEGREELLVDGYAGRKAVKVIEEIYKSSKA